MGPIGIDKMSTEGFTHAFIDVDGTLVNSINNMFNAYMQLLNHYGKCGNQSEFDKLNGPSFLEISQYLKIEYSINEEVDTIFKNYISYIKLNYLNAVPFPDSSSFLSELRRRNIVISVVTANEKDHCLPLIEKHGWDKYISHYTWGNEVKNAKPSPEIYLKAIKKVKAPMETSFTVEDSTNGVKASSDAGLKTFAVSTGYSENLLINAGAFRVTENLTSVLELI